LDLFSDESTLAALKKGAAKKKHGAYVVVGWNPTTTYSTLISAEKPFFQQSQILGHVGRGVDTGPNMPG
jgi:hypothetical protein